jgi:hypothetical protein
MWYFDDKGTRVDAKAINTTTPGKAYYDNRTVDKAFNSMVPGQYKDTYKIGSHTSKSPSPYQCLVDIESYKLVRQGAIGKYDYTKTITGQVGDHIHRGAPSGKTPRISNLNGKAAYSAGCQVFENVKDFDWMMAAARQQVNKTTRKIFDYTLLNEEDVSGTTAAAPAAPATPPPLNYKAIADQLFDAMERVNNDEDKIYTLLRTLRNQDDWTKVQAAYGIRENTIGINFTGGLKPTFEDSLTSSEVQSIKNVLAKKGITY